MDARELVAFMEKATSDLEELVGFLKDEVEGTAQQVGTARKFGLGPNILAPELAEKNVLPRIEALRRLVNRYKSSLENGIKKGRES